jgi:hypothetical protein
LLVFFLSPGVSDSTEATRKQQDAMHVQWPDGLHIFGLKITCQCPR